jgi:hypothetical protein
MKMLEEKLTVKQKKELLKRLFSFDLINVSMANDVENWVVYDDEGDEFYGGDRNRQFDFSNLEGFFKYKEHRVKQEFYLDCQFAIRKTLGF